MIKERDTKNYFVYQFSEEFPTVSELDDVIKNYREDNGTHCVIKQNRLTKNFAVFTNGSNITFEYAPSIPEEWCSIDYYGQKERETVCL